MNPFLLQHRIPVRSVRWITLLMMAGTACSDVVTPAAVDRLAGFIREQHPGLQALHLRAGAAQAQAEATRRWADPTLRAGGIGFADRGPLASEEGDVALGITQPLPVFGKESAARAVADAEAKTASETADTRFRVLKRDLMERLIQAALLNRTRALTEADLSWLRQALLHVQARQASGSVSAVQVLQLRNEVSETETRLRLQQIESQDAAARIHRLLGRPLDSTHGAWELPPKARPLTYRPEWSRQALAEEPRLRVARKLSEEAEARVEATRKSRRPNLALGLDSRQYSGDGGLRNGSATLSLTLPWLNRNQYRKDLSRDRLRFDAAQREVADLEAEVTLEIHHWLTRIEGARIRAELAGDTLIPRIRAALDTATAGLSAGSGDLRDILELRRTWLEAESKQAAAIADQWTAIADLLLTCGWSDLPQDSIPTTPASPTR